MAAISSRKLKDDPDLPVLTNLKSNKCVYET